MEYEPNPKHKEPWQRGRRGSICPVMPKELVKTLLGNSVPVGDKRYSCHEGQAYCGQEHHPGVWHGYPIGWDEVPPHVKFAWIKDGVVNKRQTRRKEFGL